MLVPPFLKHLGMLWCENVFGLAHGLQGQGRHGCITSAQSGHHHPAGTFPGPVEHLILLLKRNRVQEDEWVLMLFEGIASAWCKPGAERGWCLQSGGPHHCVQIKAQLDELEDLPCWHPEPKPPV